MNNNKQQIKKVLISALEPSANLHLEPILKEMKDFELKGIFDPSLGFEPLYPSSDFSLMGFVDALSKIKKAKKAIKEMAKLSHECDKVLLIDSPAFNLPLAKEIKKGNPSMEIIYYILPQVWAWRKNRVKKIEKYCDRLLSILPFESRFYNKSEYVGHPLLDEISDFKDRVSNSGKIAFLPGSRKSEIGSLMDIYRAVAEKVKGEKILVIPNFFDQTTIDEVYGEISGFKIYRQTHKALIDADFAFVCSGTATLEASIIGTPFILVYKAKKIDYFIAKRFVKLKHIGLANIILDFENEEPLHSELIQDEVNAKNLLKKYEKTDREKFVQNSKKLRDILKHGSAKNVFEKLYLD